MRFNAAIPALILSLAACAAAAAPLPRIPKMSDRAVTADLMPQRSVDFPGGVVAYPDLTFATYVRYRPLKLDLYLPPKAALAKGPRPVVVFVHGGGWRNGSPRYNGAFENWPDVLAALAGKGYVVATVDYRLAGEATYPAAVQDVKAAIRWLRAKADAYHIDKGRFLIWGPSAGGHIAAVAALTCGVPALSPPPDGGTPAEARESDCVQAGVGWYGSYNLPLMNTPERTAGSIAAESDFLGCGGHCSVEQQRAASPVTFVDPSDPPMLLVHGAVDRTVPTSQSPALYEALTKAGVKAEMLILPGVAHQFIGQTAEATRTASLQALERTFDFIDRTIGDK